MFDLFTSGSRPVFEASRGGYMASINAQESSSSTTKAAGREVASERSRYRSGASGCWGRGKRRGVGSHVPVETVRNVQQGEAARALVAGSSSERSCRSGCQHFAPRERSRALGNLVREAGVRRLYRGWLRRSLSRPRGRRDVPCLSSSCRHWRRCRHSPPWDAAPLPSVPQRQRHAGVT